MPDDLKALADLLERHDKEMTPGKWQPDPPQQYENDSITYIGGLGRVVGTSSADQAGIAYLRNALPALIAALERAERMREAGNRLVRELESWHEIIELQPDVDMEAIAAWNSALKEPTDAR